MIIIVDAITGSPITIRPSLLALALGAVAGPVGVGVPAADEDVGLPDPSFTGVKVPEVPLARV